MKKLVVFVILFVLLGLWGFGVILPDAGYVLITLGKKTLETSFWFACFAVVITLFVWWLLSRALSASWLLAQRVTDFFIFGSTERASKRAASGLIDFLSGDWLQARKKLLRTASKVESPLVNYLTAARCSYELGDREEALKILDEAQKKYAHFVVPIGLVQAKMEMNDGRYEQAKQLLLALQARAPKNSAVINSLRQVYEAHKDWAALNDIFPQVKKQKVCTVAETLELESSVMVGQLNLASDAALRAAVSDRLLILRKAWAKVPSYQQKIPRVIAAYVRALGENQQDNEAEAVIAKALSKTWDDELIDLYGLLRADDVAQAVRTAENWLKYQPQNPVLLRALGRLSLRHRVWGAARDYFQRSLAIQKNPETFAELARLLSGMGETQKSIELYQAAMQQSGTVLPDLPQPSRAYA